jgi:hypothetical protein
MNAIRPYPWLQPPGVPGHGQLTDRAALLLPA